MFIENIGGQTIHITRMELVLRDSSGKRWLLPVQTYLGKAQGGYQSPEYPITAIALKRGETWNEIIKSFQVLNETQDEESAQVIANVQQSILSQAGGPYKPLYEASTGSVAAAVELYKKAFNLHQGSFEFCLAVFGPQNRTRIS